MTQHHAAFVLRLALRQTRTIAVAGILADSPVLCAGDRATACDYHSRSGCLWLGSQAGKCCE